MYKICGKCGKAFEVDDKDRNARKRKYCGIECAEEVRAERVRAYVDTHRKPEKPVMCLVCGKVFMTRHSKRITCGPECNYERNKALARENAHRKTKKYLAELAAMQEPEPKPKPREQKKVESIEEIQRRARESGMSYGQYMAMIQCEKMQEERAKHGRKKNVHAKNN